MTYYRIYPEADNRKRCDGSIFVRNELYTKKELERFKVPSSYYRPVEVSKKSTYWFFGARFCKEQGY